jgi:ribosomal-protein-alanine N-acetyltransferase
MDAACRRVAAAGAQALFLEVAEDDAGARRFYGSSGFVPVGRRRGYYRRAGRGRVDALVLRRPLTAEG